MNSVTLVNGQRLGLWTAVNRSLTLVRKAAELSSRGVPAERLAQNSRSGDRLLSDRTKATMERLWPCLGGGHPVLGVAAGKHRADLFIHS